jgi:hypothetical protein
VNLAPWRSWFFRKNHFFGVLNNSLSSDSDSKKLVLDLMTSMAESSDGVSDQELETINSIKQSLNL